MTVRKGVRYRCRNGPQGASHNGARPLFEPQQSEQTLEPTPPETAPHRQQSDSAGEKFGHPQALHPVPFGATLLYLYRWEQELSIGPIVFAGETGSFRQYMQKA